MKVVTLPQYILYCPKHPKQPIGMVADVKGMHFVHGFWCKECRKHRYFTENNIKKYLKISPEPCKVPKNLTQLREDARA